MTEHTLRDINRHYAGTVVSFREGDKNVPFSIDRIEEDLNGNRIVFGAIARGRWVGLEEPKFLQDLNLEWPELGLINTARHVVHFERRSLRQWTRGFRMDLISPNIIQSDLLAVYGRRLLVDSPSTIERIYNPIYLTKEQAMEEALNNQSCRAISPDVWIGAHLRHENLVFGYKKWTVGYITDNGTFVLDRNCTKLQDNLESVVGPMEVGEL